ncbi:ATP-binding protein [Actinoplanes sp. NEAU-A12]|uniref:Sensor-like histidine kinase SenX3 n=1 Tax=Actinoplanes sandaracinus TaxID=3045177 RepID=A0ABT6WWY5_9ACTN|nr:ATP-binding protein [Actinoplanes sandaracinus]MDI6104251.1 ATP-binding protein [Actinoplanes sandaracinus]
MTTGYRLSLARTTLFAIVYAAACYTGRHFLLGSQINLVWPAAGVAVVWFCAHRRAPTRRLDMLLLPVILGGANWLTGASPAIGVVAGIVGLVQVAVFLRLLRRWSPHLWGAGGSAPLRSPWDLWALTGAGFTATIAASAVSMVGRRLITGSFPTVVTTMSVARHTASILIIGSAGICAGAAIHRLRAEHRSIAGWWRHRGPTPPWRIAEIAGISAAGVAGYLAVFAAENHVPVSFALLGLTVLVATRLSTPWVLLHNCVVSLLALRYTLTGSGPFALVTDVAQRAVVVQLFAILVALVGLSLALARDERRRLLAALAQEKAELAARQVELARQKAEITHHADLLTAIIDSMADGLAVIGPDRRVTLRNPAVADLFGGRAGRDDVLSGTDWSGLRPVDGARYAEGELAYLQALADKEVSGVDMLVQNQRVPDGRVVRVTATALAHPNGTFSTVVLFHDVTAERRHRDELINFAGMVAHDLLNPLASVDGWAAAARDALDGVPEHPDLDQARADLARLAQASARMRGLIDGLLSYATVRQAMVAPARVDLAEVVADIAVARADAAVASGKPEPRFTIGRLPPVQADPVLVRQLIDNLVGNAIKYTAPGVVPALRITAGQDGAMVTVRIVDNGIGVPEGQHEAIFGNFHRAHVDSGYLGTGLGLAICRRIVERHGGTITATDDPGGGSCFTFTLPSAVESPNGLAPVSAASRPVGTMSRIPH